MKASTSAPPVLVLLELYRDGLAGILESIRTIPRIKAILDAPLTWLNPVFLDGGSDDEFAEQIVSFYQAVVPLPLHTEGIRSRARAIRHGVNHLFRCEDPVALKLERCLEQNAPYAIPGLGLSFWGAVAQGARPDLVPTGSPEAREGLVRLALLRRQPSGRSVEQYARMVAAFQRLQKYEPTLPAWQLEHFLGCVRAMRGRELLLRPDPTTDASLPLCGAPLVTYLVRQERTRLPLRPRVKEWGAHRAMARARFDAALRQDDPTAAADALSTIAANLREQLDNLGLDRFRALTRLWFEDASHDWGDDSCNGEIESSLALAAAIHHLQDANRYPLWHGNARHGYACLDDSFDPTSWGPGSYQLFVDGVGALCSRFRIHAAEVADLLQAARRHHEEVGSVHVESAGFRGFSSDTFRFLRELDTNNHRAWMDRQRERYRYAVREPLIELCSELAKQYVEPVLNGDLGLELVTAPRTGKSLTSIVKNDFGQTVPYQPLLWVTFFRRQHASRRSDAQLFIRLDPSGLSFGLHLARTAREAGKRFRRNVQEHSEVLFRALEKSGALKACLFRTEEPAGEVAIRAPADLRTWAGGKVLFAQRVLATESPLLLSPDLSGEILLTFEQVLPAFLCAVLDDPRPVLNHRYRLAASSPDYGRDSFLRATYLSTSWLERAFELLQRKRQLVLQGVPGTGKTHIASHLARLLTGDRPENVRVVQFHPAFSYEEFIEGIKARTVEVNGRHEVTYPVEEGVLCSFAARAANRPGEPHVLLIDEINRGNLPRIFGELLYLLEYRDRAIILPYSRREFRLPANLFVIGTMNSADRSITSIDQALRRRFSFVAVGPDAAVLASWLEANVPGEREPFARDVVRLFEDLNERLARDFGPQCQIGHSYFMLPDLDLDRLRVAWKHDVWPVLEGYANGQNTRLKGYELEPLLDRKPRQKLRPGA